MPEILDRKRRSIRESHAKSTRHSTISPQTLRNSILRSEIQNPAIAEADAYRPCGTNISTSDTSPSPTSIRLPLTVKPLRQYQTKSENLYTSEGFRCISTTSSSSSLPRMSKTILPSSSKTLCKTLSDDFKQNSQNICSDDIIKSKCKSETSMKKFLHGINTTICAIARPVYCDNEMVRDSCDSVSSLQKAAVDRRSAEPGRSLPSTNTLASSNTGDSTVDIKWEVPKCNSKSESKCGTTEHPTKSILKVVRPRRLTVASSTINDWSNITENTTPERNVTIRKSIIASDSLKRKTTRESLKKPWFSSSVDGPPVTSQIHETGIDDDLPCKRLIAPRFYPINGSLSVPIQKPTVVKSDNSQNFHIRATTPPPKPTRTYEEVSFDLLQTEHQPKLDIKSVRKICPIMSSSRIAIPKDYRSNRDNSTDSGFEADSGKNSSETIESNSDIQISGKWLQAIDLPCDSYSVTDEDLMLSENSLLRFFF